MPLWTALSVTLALFQLRCPLRKLEKMSPALEQGGMRPGTPVPRSRLLPHFSQCAHFPPKHKGTWKLSDLLSAVMIATKMDHSRRRQLGKKSAQHFAKCL